MKIIAGLILCSAAAAFGQAPNTNNVTGQWDFDAGDLRATTGEPLAFRGETAPLAGFEEAAIAGGRARVLRLGELAPELGLTLAHGAAANGGGTNVNQYTLIMDVLWPAESSDRWRALLQSDTNNVLDPILFVSSGNGIGINNNYQGQIAPNVWYRIAAVFDLNPTNSTLTKYVIGGGVTNNFAQPLGGNALDGRFSLGPTALLFTGALGDSAPVLVNSLQFRSAAMTAEEVASLGGPTAGGISGGSGLPLEDVKIERVQRAGAEIVLTVSGGGTLQAQQSPSLAAPAWQNAGAPAATNTFRIPAAGSKAFFRVLRP